MLKRIRNTKIGDVFSVPISETEKRYMQYIVSDMSQLNSDVIRAFKKIYPLDAAPTLNEIVSDQVDFYAHCTTKSGLRTGQWEKVGNIAEVGSIDHILFRSNANIEGDNDKWHIWHINGEFIQIGVLTEDIRKSAELGAIFSTDRIVQKFKTGAFSPYYATI